MHILQKRLVPTNPDTHTHTLTHVHTHQKLWSVNDGITIIIFVHIKCSACHLLLVSLFVHPSFDPALALKIVNTFNAGTNNGTNELIIFYESMPNGRMIKAKHIHILNKIICSDNHTKSFIHCNWNSWMIIFGWNDNDFWLIL